MGWEALREFGAVSKRFDISDLSQNNATLTLIFSPLQKNSSRRFVRRVKSACAFAAA
jgi:hypothetical protein